MRETCKETFSVAKSISESSLNPRIKVVRLHGNCRMNLQCPGYVTKILYSQKQIGGLNVTLGLYLHLCRYP